MATSKPKHKPAAPATAPESEAEAVAGAPPAEEPAPVKPTPVKLEALRPVPSDMFTAGHPPNERVARGKTFTAPSRQVADDLIGAGYAREPKG